MPQDAPDCPCRLPQVGIHQVTVQVHRHRCRGVPQDPLHHLGIGASTEPDRRRGMAPIVHPEPLEPGRRRGSTPADRALPVRFTQRPATRRLEQPGIRCPRTAHRRRRWPARYDAASGQAREPTPDRRPADRPARPSADRPAPGPAPHRGNALARFHQRPQFRRGERLAFPASTAASRLACRRRDIVLHASVGHGEREDRAHGGQGTGRSRRRQAASHQRADPTRHLRRGDRGHRPVAETRLDVVPPRRLIAFPGSGA
jgi:hypothetical protein